jgi:hypothetical protein
MANATEDSQFSWQAVFFVFMLFTLTFSKITEDNEIGECGAQDGGKQGTVDFEKAHGSEPTQLSYLPLQDSQLIA